MNPATALSLPERGRPYALDDLTNRLFDWFFYAFVFITIFLPSGSVYGVNLKLPMYLALLPLATLTLFRRGYVSWERLFLLFLVPIVLSIWIVIGIAHGVAFAGALRQYMDIVLVLFLAWLVLVSCGDADARRIRFLRLVLYAEVATSVFKVGLIAYAALRGIPTVVLVTSLSQVFGVNLMTMDLGAMFGRVQFVSDAVIPVCVYTVLRHRERLRIGNLWASAIVILLIASVLFSFSRYLWAFTAVAFVVGLLTGRRDRFQLLLSSLLLLSIMVSLPGLVTLYQLRFSTEVAGNSDQIRTDQTLALKEFFEDAPIFGHGLGSYTTQDVRDQETGGGVRYSYEAQLLALTGQIGLVGMTLLVLLGVYYYSDLWWRSSSSLTDRAALGLLIAFWIASGLYNPLLFHPVAGINYAAFAALVAVTDAAAKNVSVSS